tara:strand:- start:261 stop:578 length:318 start_codon:yes stop_codon:yes gene_type:complete
MSNTHLDNQEVEELYRLFEDIKLDLSSKDFPTRTNRLEAVENMARVLEIHGWKCIRDPLISEDPSKSQREEAEELTNVPGREYDEDDKAEAEELSKDKHQGRIEI